MHKRRLLKLADLLEADAKNKKGVKFDLSGWGYTVDNSPVSVSCGTTACAMGLAVISGAFKRAGLRNDSLNPDTIDPAIGRSYGFGAAEVLFGIERRESRFLFSDSAYPPEYRQGAVGERFVAKRIRDFVAGEVSPA